MIERLGAARLVSVVAAVTAQGLLHYISLLLLAEADKAPGVKLELLICLARASRLMPILFYYGDCGRFSVGLLHRSRYMLAVERALIGWYIDQP